MFKGLAGHLTEKNVHSINTLPSNNIELFDCYAGLILGHLYRNFPLPITLTAERFIDYKGLADSNREALEKTAELSRAVYFSRSRKKLWFKGEESGHVQTVHEIRLDCDNDVVLLKVTQQGHEPGIACHTGRHSCFFSVLKDGAWHAVDPVLKDPESIYK